MIKRFTAQQFTPSKFATAEEKANFANSLARFIDGAFQESKFTLPLYRRLSLTFGHIAHYNQAGFYDAQFADASHIARFLDGIASHPCYGDPAYTFSDVESALQAWVKSEGLAEKWHRIAHNEAVQRDLATLARLRAQYPNA